ncbi:MAG: HAD-IIIA family hydrolase [Candidatus Eremiobacteraeota bacterium]|nr:HAD-IIIA family hydrolase [Candidatus Eremiobacteraeota bacterium]
MIVPGSQFPTRGVRARIMQHAAPDGSRQETPLLAVSYHQPSDQVEGGRGAIFVDRDGVLNRFGNMKKAEDLDRLLQPNAVESLLRLMSHTKMPVYVVTNQQRAAKDDRTLSQVEASLDRLCQLVVENGGKFAGVLFCPSRSQDPVPKGMVSGHKPNAGMFLEAARLDSLDLSQSYMVGDSVKDMLAAKQAHPEMTTLLVATGHGGRDESQPHPPEASVACIGEAADWIIGRESGRT